MSGGRYHQHGCVSGMQTASSVDVRCPEKAPSKVWRCCSMKKAVGQNAQPECDSLHNSQPLEFMKQWGYAFKPPRWKKKQMGGGIQDGLQPVLQLSNVHRYQRELSCHSPPCWQSVHKPMSARHDMTEIAACSGSDVEPRSTLWQRLWRGSSWSR